MLSAFANCFKIQELRQRILFTLGLVFVARLGSNIPLPGINPLPLEAFFAAQAQSSSALLGLANMFTGGALMKGAIFGLGIMPYISASIIMQLMTAALPSLARLQQEGDVGRQKIVQLTRYLTIVICFVQSILLLLALLNYPERLFPGYSLSAYGPIVIASPFGFLLRSTLFLTAGTSIMMWLGEQITERGIGNGVSLLITVGIVSGMPGSISQLLLMFTAPLGTEGPQFGLIHACLLISLLLLVIAAMVAVTQVQRKIPVQYAQRMIGRKLYSAQSSFLPLKVNYSGIMPVIFASAILVFPQQIFAYLGGASGIKFFQHLAYGLTQGSLFYYLVFGFLILAFSYFWVSMMFKPVQIADEIKKNGGYVPGVRPGEATAKFLDFVMTRLTLAGSIFLTLIALFPDILYFTYHIPYSVALFFGGTGTLITVGVVLETIKQMETYLLQRHYDGFLKKGSRSRAASVLPLVEAEVISLRLLWIPLVVIFFIGMIAWVLRQF